jgi:pyruvate dehydrogenase E2 component (dihydrolipoamide acetyltransferase)/2-oxoglutarate dehydrogenase E2 component (dihydrolipoamide succinyltransferase)
MHVVILPKTGMYEDDIVLVDWLVEEGAMVRAGDPIFVIESEKVEMEIEADVDGWVHREAQPGLEAPIGTRIGVISDTEDEHRALAAGS